MTETAFIFPGQGSQTVGMLQELARDFPRINATFEEAGEVLGLDLLKLVREGPAERLAQTEFTQPVMLAASVALWRVWCDEGGAPPAAVAGHSLGEYSALVAADVLDFPDAVALVRKRGQFMQAAVPLGEGGMAAILGLEDAVVEQVCAEISEQAGGGAGLVEPANYNAPGQLVIAGHRKALELALAALKEKGARRALLLDVSAPFHCSLMAPAARQLRELLDALTFRPPQLLLVQNVDAAPTAAPDAIRDKLLAQLSGAVLWSGCIATLKAEGITKMVECGPGRVLSGLCRRTAPDIETVALNTRDAFPFPAGG